MQFYEKYIGGVLVIHITHDSYSFFCSILYTFFTFELYVFPHTSQLSHCCLNRMSFESRFRMCVPINDSVTRLPRWNREVADGDHLSLFMFTIHLRSLSGSLWGNLQKKIDKHLQFVLNWQPATSNMLNAHLQTSSRQVQLPPKTGRTSYRSSFPCGRRPRLQLGCCLSHSLVALQPTRKHWPTPPARRKPVPEIQYDRCHPDPGVPVCHAD